MLQLVNKVLKKKKTTNGTDTTNDMNPKNTKAREGTDTADKQIERLT